MSIGGVSFDLSAGAVRDEDEIVVGSVVEWHDVSSEVASEKEVGQIVEAARRGDVSKRVPTDDKTGFMLILSRQINELLAVNQAFIEDLSRVFGAMAEGDLSETVEENYAGALGALAAAANTSIEKLAAVTSDIRSSAVWVRDGVGEIAQGIAQLSERTEQQASSLEETASSMEEMTSTVQESAANANTADGLAASASDTATQGGEVVAEAIEAMRGINDASQRIANIIGVIDEIAFQTNLLALNAAVEAARAGEQGRGFAVVASEVRNLAQRSADAAKEIKDLIEDTVRRVEQGSKLVNASGETLRDIVTAVSKVKHIIAEIAAAGKEQALGIEQVNRAITQMDEMTQQNAALVEESASASANMREIAHRMHERVSFFTQNKESIGC